MAVTFEDGVEYIPPTEECLQYQWVLNGPVLVGIIEELKEDNFVSGGMSISEGIDILNEADKELDESNYFYVDFPDKKPLMEEIIQLMTAYKAAKTSIDPQILSQAITQYNNNLELALKTFFNNYLKKICVAYNNSGDNRIRLSIMVYNKERNYAHQEALATWSGDRLVPKNYTLRYGEKFLPDTITWDTIKTDALKTTSNSIEGLDAANRVLMSELSKRGISFQTIDERPSEAR